MRRIKYVVVALMMGICSSFISYPEEQQPLYNKFLKAELKHPEIVYAQAILETGWLNSKAFREKNNLFGLYDSRKHELYTFKSVDDCILAYKKWIQNKYYKGGDYYDFLNCMWKNKKGECKKYASASNYTQTVEKVRQKLFNRSSQ